MPIVFEIDHFRRGYNRALEFAEKMHKGQHRKYDDTPYIIHPIRVAASVMSKTIFTLDTVQIALLHDVIEDTSAVLQDITKEFGSEVAAGVDALTNPSKPENNKHLPRADRKKMDREHIAAAPVDIQWIKLCDRIDNIDSFIRDAAVVKQDNPEFLGLYIKESRELYNVLKPEVQKDRELIVLLDVLEREAFASS